MDAPGNQNPPRDAGEPARRPQDFTQFSRWHPSHGGPTTSDTYLGKLVPGLRRPGLPPVPVVTPDVPDLPFRMEDGWKVFHLTAEHVRRELFPGHWIDLWGYNGSVPGPTIQATQGDRVRIVLHNRLPESTTLHFFGGEMDNALDGVQGLTGDPVPAGRARAYEFHLHQAGTFYYHSHFPLELGQGMIGFFIIHPRVAHDPPVDRDFAIAFQDWMILPNQTVPDPFVHSGTWKTINGRQAPYTTPMVVKHGERVRIRVTNFSKFLPHAIHLHGYTFWQTGFEGARQPTTIWQARNTTFIHVGQTTEVELIANNPGDWVCHCHMVEHMLNFNPLANPIGPRIREGADVSRYRRARVEQPPDRGEGRTERPAPDFPHTHPGHQVPGYPQRLRGWGFTEDQIRAFNSKREVRGMRHNWYVDIKGLFTVLRVLPESLYNLVMHSDEPLQPGEIFRRISEGRQRGRDRGQE